MHEVITAAGTLPTAVFTGLLIASLFYWLMVILGAFDFGLGHGHGGEGVGHGAGDHSGGPDAAGHAEAGHGHGEGHDHGEGGSEQGHGLIEFLSIGQVPLSITVSAVVFIAWIVSMTIDLMARGALAGMVPAALFGALQAGASLVAGLVAGGFLVRPLRPLFNADGEHGQQHLEGKMVRITSLTVDERHGAAACETSGPDILLNVVCRAGVTLARNEQAVVVEYDQARGVYLVAPLPHLRPGFAALDAPVPPAPSAPSAAGAPLAISAALDVSAPPTTIAARPRATEGQP